MQDGAPSHIARQVTALLRAHFRDGHVISRGFPAAWPPRSPDLNPCDFWLWGFLKDHVYRRNNQTAPELKAIITFHVSSVYRDIICATVEQSTTRFEHVVDVNGMRIEQMCN